MRLKGMLALIAIVRLAALFGLVSVFVCLLPNNE
jgi:hypothetical protein